MVLTGYILSNKLMFETHDSAEVLMPLELNNHGARVWSRIRNQAHIHWFHVVYSQADHDDYTSRRILFLSHIDQLIELCQDKGVYVLEVSLVSAGHFNGKGRWQMQLLDEVWVGTLMECSNEQQAELFVTNEGTRYVSFGYAISEYDLVNPKLVYKQNDEE